jgi:hypothetical protein
MVVRLEGKTKDLPCHAQPERRNLYFISCNGVAWDEFENTAEFARNGQRLLASSTISLSCTHSHTILSGTLAKLRKATIN